MDEDEDTDKDKDEWDDTWLRATEDGYGNPIAIEILDHFLDLPPCTSAAVRLLRGLEYRPLHLPVRDPERRIFDRDYTEDLRDALVLWLRGDREGVKLPDGVSKDYGEPRLEQITYEKAQGTFLLPWCS